MSIPVDLGDLAGQVADRPFGYLVTVGDDSRPKVIALAPQMRSGELWFAVGGSSADNVAARPRVTVVFPPTPDDPYTLLVDGAARGRPTSRGGAAGDAAADVAGGATWVVIRPTWAVRHRPAPPSPEPQVVADAP